MCWNLFVFIIHKLQTGFATKYTRAKNGTRWKKAWFGLKFIRMENFFMESFFKTCVPHKFHFFKILKFSETLKQQNPFTDNMSRQTSAWAQFVFTHDVQISLRIRIRPMLSDVIWCYLRRVLICRSLLTITSNAAVAWLGPPVTL